MMMEISNTLKVLHHYRKMVMFTFVGGLFGASLMWSLLAAAVFFEQGNFPDEFSAVSEVSGLVMNSAVPIRLKIPSVGIDTIFEDPLGLDAQNQIEIPDSYETVGWYKYGPTPGEIGPSVVLGHVDSYEGPAVFYKLKNLKEGDEVFIDREDGTTATFEVTGLSYASQDEFPTDRVYGDIDYAGLRLVTCIGTYNKDELRYSQNLIVYASLKNGVTENIY